MTLLQFWESTRPAKHKTAPVDRLRYSTIQLCYENGWNLIDEEHPRSGKSEANNLYSVAWWLSTHPSFKFGLVTHSQALGNKFLGAVAKLLRDAGFEFEYERASEFKIKGSAGIDPSFWVSGIGGGHTGKGCHRLLLDDLLRSGSDALSDKIREGIVTDVVSTALNRIEPYDQIPGATTLLQARLHESDPVGWALNESGLDFVRLHLPATNDDGTSAFIENQYTDEKNFLPAYAELTPRFPRAKLDEVMGMVTSYFWFSQWMMEPKLGDQTYFDLSRCPRHQNGGNISAWWFCLDAANTATKSGSRTAMVAMGFDERSSLLKVLGCVAGRWRADEMGQQMEAFGHSMMRVTGQRPMCLGIERAAGGYALIDRYQSSWPITPITPLGSKEERAGGVCYLVNRGSVSLPESAPWLKEFESEVGGFPLAALSDISDAFTHCLSVAARPSEFKHWTEHEEMMVYEPEEDTQVFEMDGFEEPGSTPGQGMVISDCTRMAIERHVARRNR